METSKEKTEEQITEQKNFCIIVGQTCKYNFQSNSIRNYKNLIPNQKRHSEQKS